MGRAGERMYEKCPRFTVQPAEYGAGTGDSPTTGMSKKSWGEQTSPILLRSRQGT